MPRINPNKHIRKAYKTALQNIAPIWEKKVPKGTTVPEKYFLISTQTKQSIERSKPLSDTDANVWEWQTSIVVEAIVWQALGFADSEPIDDLEQALINAIEAGITVDDFDVKSVIFVDSVPLDTETPTHSIYRRVITYEHWMQEQ